MSEWDHLYRAVGMIVVWLWIAAIAGVLLHHLRSAYRRARAWVFVHRLPRCRVCTARIQPHGYICDKCALAAREAHAIYTRLVQ